MYQVKVRSQSGSFRTSAYLKIYSLFSISRPKHLPCRATLTVSFIRNKLAIMTPIKTTICLLIYGLLGSGCHVLAHKRGETIPDQVKLSAVKGDFDGDGVREYAWLLPPKFTSDSMDCVGKCGSIIKFSGKHIPSIDIDNCIGGQPVNLGDLNDDGSDEIGLLPEWFTSCWRNYFVFTYRQGKWVNAVPPFPVHCNTVEEGFRLVKKDTSKPGHIIIRYSEFENSQIVTKTKSVPVN
jgi:hypothetical protein